MQSKSVYGFRLHSFCFFLPTKSAIFITLLAYISIKSIILDENPIQKYNVIDRRALDGTRLINKEKERW